MQKFPWHLILEWYQNNGRKWLPWRDYNISDQNLLIYRVWISEILLQQTQAERVISYFEKILQKFPNIASLSNSNYDEFFPYYQGMGYYSRARNILKTAKIIYEKYSMEFPENKLSLQKLPWIGDYTSSAILAFGFGKPFLAWDTNLEKIFSRFYHGNKIIRLTSDEKSLIEKDFCDFIHNLDEKNQKNAVRAINNGLMDFSRMIDDKNPANIDWWKYIIKSWVFYNTRGSMENFENKKIENFPIPDAKIIAILHENHKKYFSEHKNYTPFLLSASENRDTRAFVKNFFKKNYNLEVSVRPIHNKWLSKAGEPFIAVNVQIQTGSHFFEAFEKKIAKTILETIYNN